MKRSACAWLLILATATGCVTLPKTFPKPANADKPDSTPKSDAAAAAPKPKRPSAVTAEQVTEANAHAISQALSAELDRETPPGGEK
jgi:hypothetical protein